MNPMSEGRTLGERLLQLAVCLVGWVWSTIFLLRADDPSPYRIALALAASVVLGSLLTLTFRVRRPAPDRTRP